MSHCPACQHNMPLSRRGIPPLQTWGHCVHCRTRLRFHRTLNLWFAFAFVALMFLFWVPLVQWSIEHLPHRALVLVVDLSVLAGYFYLWVIVRAWVVPFEK